VRWRRPARATSRAEPLLERVVPHLVRRNRGGVAADGAVSGELALATRAGRRRQRALAQHQIVGHQVRLAQLRPVGHSGTVRVRAERYTFYSKQLE